MVVSKLITGTLIQSFNICHRQTWLMAHQIIPDQEHQYIELGRLLDEESYGRDKKKINYENVVLDLIRSEDGDIVIGEVKKSSRAKDSARMQLAFYLYKLKQNGVMARGLLLFPKERKREMIELTPELEEELEEVFNKIYMIIMKETPPAFKKIGYCKHCGYKEFCWS
ncbi:MAG TPA: CRISPR-associated protein Cas4 [Thermoanaerobacterales bacterium]|nr:CRISPR-associated protein Cas4 [Thermoanaerobacterales bacterium]